MTEQEYNMAWKAINDIADKFGLDIEETFAGPVIEQVKPNGSWLVVSCVDSFDICTYDTYDDMINCEPSWNTYYDTFDIDIYNEVICIIGDILAD